MVILIRYLTDPYCEVEVRVGGVILDLGVLDKAERIVLANAFSNAADELLRGIKK